MANDPLPITPAVLTWARERAALRLEEARQRFPRIDAWEAGEACPTHPQLEALSSVLRLPPAVFFFPEPPSVPRIRQSFRTLPSTYFDDIPGEIRTLLRKATVFQLNLAELNDGSSGAERLAVHDLSFSQPLCVESSAEATREYLGVSLDEQIAWPDSAAALESWRAALESVGVAVFKDAFRTDVLSGFCLYDQTFPLIYVNNSSAVTRQIFTLFHELAHLLFHTSGVDRLPEQDVEGLPPVSRSIEIACNQFAAELSLYMWAKLLCPASSSCSAALRYHLAASALSSGTPKPRSYMWASPTCPEAQPCSAALRYHATASAWPSETSQPFAYMPSQACARGWSRAAALRNHVTALA